MIGDTLGGSLSSYNQNMNELMRRQLDSLAGMTAAQGIGYQPQRFAAQQRQTNEPQDNPKLLLLEDL